MISADMGDLLSMVLSIVRLAQRKEAEISQNKLFLQKLASSVMKVQEQNKEMIKVMTSFATQVTETKKVIFATQGVGVPYSDETFDGYGELGESTLFGLLQVILKLVSFLEEGNREDEKNRTTVNDLDQTLIVRNTFNGYLSSVLEEVSFSTCMDLQNSIRGKYINIYIYIIPNTNDLIIIRFYILYISFVIYTSIILLRKRMYK